jgi:hypothetical protein
MKSRTVLVFLFLLISNICLADQYLEFSNLHDQFKSFSNSEFALYLAVDKSEDFIDLPFPVYMVYAHHLKTNKVTKLSTTHFKSTEVKIASDGYFYFDAYSGGNSINAENRKILMKYEPTEARYIGTIAGYSDVDSDGTPDFYNFVLTELGKPHADATYKNQILKVINNTLVPGE